MRGLWRSFRDIFESVIEVVLPSRERVLRIKSRTFEELELAVSTEHLCGIEITTLLSYRSTIAEDTIRALKYDNSQHAARLCAAVLADYLREELTMMRSLSPRPILLVPVPLHESRKYERGFNQIERVLQELPGEFTDGTLSSVSTSALVRTRQTQQQTRLSKSTRLENVKGAFKAQKECRGAHIILIDDVATTGATLAECSDACTKTGAVVTAIALARA